VTAAIVFLFTYVALSIGRVPGLRSDRLAASVIGAVALVAFRVLSFREAQAAVDGATLALLFGMMLLSAALDISGTFALAGFWMTKRASRPITLLVAISVASAVLSAFLINDVVCIAFTPLVLKITATLKKDAKPYLLALATSSNIGSVATITGNPQNILIASLSHISYGRFAASLAPVAATALILNIAVIAFVHRAELAIPFEPHVTTKRPRVHSRLVLKSSTVVIGVLLAFVVGVTPAVAALVGGALMLFSRAVNPKRLYVRVDWTLLALFVGLFVVVAGFEKAGLAEIALRALMPLRPDSVVGLTIISAILSNVASNVPAVMVLKSMIPHLPNVTSSWLTLAMASTLAGNLTLPGSLATIIVVERAKGHTSVSFTDFLRVGIPSALLSLTFGVIWLSILR
jgi:Na+/H+ antiporter NhaD/arsenite permease-like protein